MSAFWALVRREFTLAWKSGGAGLALVFFVMTIALLPLAGAEPDDLRRIGPGEIWVSALLAQLLTLERLVQADLEDGTLDFLIGAALPLEGTFIAKALGHWLSVGLPITLMSLMGGVLLGLDEPWRPAFSLAIGLPGLSALGSMLAALTAGIRRGSLLLALLVLPLATPYVIFGASAASGGRSALLMLGALSLFSIATSLLLGARALRAQAE